jgi:hypothetical protein
LDSKEKELIVKIQYDDHHGSKFSDTETNIALIIILAVMLLLFWLPFAELVK